jgi:hypothetical protein
VALIVVLLWGRRRCRAIALLPGIRRPDFAEARPGTARRGGVGGSCGQRPSVRRAARVLRYRCCGKLVVRRAAVR